MSGCNCKKKSCSKCSGSQSEAQTLAQAINKLSEMEAKIDTLEKNTKFLDCGSPIMMLHRQSDLDCFDMETGLGSACWEGWVVCDGGTYTDSDGNNVVVPNMLNRFPVGAGDTYAVGDEGGAATVTLTVAQLPAHNHTITDTGHAHAVTDPGHDHGADAAAHTHTFTGAPHTHVMDSAGAHTHNVQVDNQGTGLRGGGDNNTATSGLSTFTTDGNGTHTHTIGNATAAGTVGDATSAISIDPSTTGISIDENTTGIAINDEGDGEPHNNLPPYKALLFVFKLG